MGSGPSSQTNVFNIVQIIYAWITICILIVTEFNSSDQSQSGRPMIWVTDQMFVSVRLKKRV